MWWLKYFRVGMLFFYIFLGFFLLLLVLLNVVFFGVCDVYKNRIIYGKY